MRATRYATVETMLGELAPGYPVFCLRPGRFRAQAERFMRLFPGKVLYAVKCNPHPAVLQALWRAGIRDFDTASLAEVALVGELFEEAECYFHHPVKSRAAIQSAAEVYGVRFFSIDHPDELAKVHQETRGAPLTLMVRLKTAAGVAAYDLSAKFGAAPEVAVSLLRQARAIGHEVGLSFHVGSQCRQPEAYAAAIRLAAQTIAAARVRVEWLNIGGGFPAEYAHQQTPPLEDFMRAIGEALAPVPAEVRRMCEPGRALVADGCSLVVQVQLRKDGRLYINDGIYGSLSEFVYDKEFGPPLRLFRAGGEVTGAPTDYEMFGPTCDANDRLPRPFRLPADVREGDWIEIGQLGAYSNALTTRFNGFGAETYVEIEEGG